MRKIVAVFTVAAVFAVGAYAWKLFRQAGELRDRVEMTEQRADELSNVVASIRQEADRSLDAIEAAEALQRQAAENAAEETRRKAQAEQERAAAQSVADRAQESLQASLDAAEAAAAEAEQQRRKRRQEWQRFGAALRKTAPTKTGSRLHVVTLEPLRRDAQGGFDLASRERLSRLAGVLLGNYGYAVRLGGDQAASVQAYLTAAGLPEAAITVESTQGPTTLAIAETVLDQP